MYETAQQIYTQLEGNKHSFLRRGRDASELTIPYVLPPDGHSASTTYYTPYQGIGARGVNNLASKLLLALLPPNAPFFRLSIDGSELQKAQEELGQAQTEQIKTKLDKALATHERSIMQEIESQAFRVGAFEALKQLIVTGNSLIYLPDQGGMRVFRLDRYVVKRDPMGNVTHIAIKESISPMMLPESVRNAAYSDSKENTCDLYTAICRKEDKFEVFQDVKGIRIEENSGSYPLGQSPFIPLRYTRIDGEDYGRGFVEEYLGDLKSLESLTQAIVEGSAAAAKVLFLVNPNGTTKARTLSESSNGAIVQGNAGDVSVLQLQKFNDFRVAQETMRGIQERLSNAFLLNSSVVRQAERVTAEEIRMLSQELETALGGLYSILSQEFQMPMVERLMTRMTSKGKLPKLPKNIVKPTITTGVEALGRGNDLNKLDMFIAGANQIVGPQAVQQYLNVSDYFTRRATSLGIETEGLIKTEEEVAQATQQAQLQALASQLGGPAINALGNQAQQTEEEQQE
jgi:hypothetical protein|tara:strand:- start:1323 stop:2867 length:1545 start_codon:yes stop_codon:yes gene_type:complete